MSRFFLGGLFMFLFRFLIYYFIVDKYEIESKLVARFPNNKCRIDNWIRKISNMMSFILTVMLLLLLSFLFEEKLGISSDFLYW